MAAELQIENSLPDNVQSPRMHPQQFAMWLAIATMVMLFAGLTSAYIVRKGAGNWVEFVMPLPFYLSGAFMLLSSVTIALAQRAFKKENLSAYKFFLTATVLFASTFACSQFVGWQQLQDIGIYIEGNPSGSFIYAISFLHIAHVGVGFVLLLLAFLKAFIVFRNPAIWLIYHTDVNKSIRINLLATYWHFVDVLWLYLLIFFAVS